MNKATNSLTGHFCTDKEELFKDVNDLTVAEPFRELLGLFWPIWSRATTATKGLGGVRASRPANYHKDLVGVRASRSIEYIEDVAQAALSTASATKALRRSFRSGKPFSVWRIIHLLPLLLTAVHTHCVGMFMHSSLAYEITLSGGHVGQGCIV